MTEKTLHGILAHMVAFFAVFSAAAVGSVHLLPQLIITFGGLTVFLLALVAARSRHSRVSVPALFFLFLFLFLIMLIQVIPLPLHWIRGLNPHLHEIRIRLDHSQSPLSYDAPATLFGAFRLLGYAGFLFGAYQVTRQGMYTQRMVQIIAFSGVFLAFLFFVHHFGEFSRMYGLYAPRERGSYFLPFVNPNHASGFYLFIFFCLLSLGMAEPGARLRFFTLGSAFLPFLAVIWTGSRAGIFAMGLGLVVWRLLAGFARDGTHRYAWILVSFVVLLVSIPLMDHYLMPFLEVTTSLDEDGKILIWQNASHLLRDHAFTGVGRGSFPSVFPFYYQLEHRIHADFVENVLLQFLVDFGWIVGGAVLAAGGFMLVRYFRGVRLRVWKVGLITGVFTLVAQNLFDFNLAFPGTALSMVVILGVLSAQRIHVGGRAKKRVLHRTWVLAVPWVLVTVLAIWWLPFRVMPRMLEVERQNVARLGAKRQWAEMAAAAADAQKRHPSDYYLAAARGIAEVFVPEGTPLRWIGLSSWLFPLHHYPELMAARVLGAWRRHQQAVLQYRRAFEKGAPLNWGMIQEIRPHLGSNLEMMTLVPRKGWTRLVNLMPNDERLPLCRAMLREKHLSKTCNRILQGDAHKRQDWAMMERLLREELSQKGETLRPLLLLAVALYRLDRPDEARPILDDLMRRHPRHGVVASIRLVEECRRDGLAKAVATARRRLDQKQLSPVNAMILLETLVRILPERSPELPVLRNQHQMIQKSGRSFADRDIYRMLDFLWTAADCPP